MKNTRLGEARAEGIAAAVMLTALAVLVMALVAYAGA